MSYKTVVLLIVFCIHFSIFHITGAQADYIEKNGYKIAVDWELQGSKLHVWGIIKEGKLCEKLEVSVNLINNTKNQYAHITDVVNYHTRHGIKFRGKDKIHNKSFLTRQNEWKLKSLYPRCRD